MDKKLNRQIGYRPNQGKVVVPVKTKQEKKDKILNPEEIMTNTESSNEEGKNIAKWINWAAIVNRTALCKAANIDRGNLDKFLLKGEIPTQHIESIKKVIKEYGYDVGV